MRLLPALAALIAISVVACAPADVPEEDVDSSEAAYTGTIPEMNPTNAPPGAARSWVQPESEGAFGKNGYCGATAAANTLAWYGRNVSPRQAIDDGCWSFVGTRPTHLAAYMQDKHPELGCSAETLDRNDAGLPYLEWMVSHGHPVMIEFMVGKLNAHWVTVVGVRGRGNDKRIVVASDGGYYSILWRNLHDAWRSGWGGPFPHVVCTTPVTGARAASLTVER